MIQQPYSEASERNKFPILEVLKRYLNTPVRVAEIGSGTGQHAVFFAQHLPHVQWQPSDRTPYLEGIRRRLETYTGNNLADVVELDVHQESWPQAILEAQCVFTANTLHIMSWQAVQATFAKVGQILEKGQLFFCYGPFNQHCQYTSESNRQFDCMLQQRDPESGIRDIDDLILLAQAAQLSLLEQCPMPANNQVLVWQSTRHV